MLKFLLRIRKVLLPLALACLLFSVCTEFLNGQQLPVIPFPQQVEEGNKLIRDLSHFKLDYSALDAEASKHLALHDKSTPSGPSVKLYLFDGKSDLATYSKWKVKIGQEGYVLILNNARLLIIANTETGLFYGLQTLKQLSRNKWNKEILIVDWPSLPLRAVYDDISRGPISTVDYIKQQIERLAELKINYLSFYIEHVVQPLSHPDFAPSNGKLTIAQIKSLSLYAERFHMQLIGSFQSFGHFEKILALPQYTSMGETSTLLSPIDPKAKQFLSDVIGELCDAFNAPFFNVNCDETFGIADGRSKKYIDSIGVPKFYADHIKYLYGIVKAHGKKLMMWGDVALQHQEIIDLLPKDIIYLTWEYGDQQSFDEWIQPFAKRQLPFVVCPGILNSYRMFPDMIMAKANISKFVKAGGQTGTMGAMTTIWDDGGTFLFSGDWYGVYVSAEKSWNTYTAPENSFDDRYESVAYGQKNNYVKALEKLMELRNVPLTYSLNDQLWNQKILPDSGKTLIVNNASAAEALKFLHEAEQLIAPAEAKINKTDLSTLRYSIQQYQLMIDTRISLAQIATEYVKQAHAGSKDSLTHFIHELTIFETRYQQLQKIFTAAWLTENQPYWLDIAAKPYLQKIKAIEDLKENLNTALVALTNKNAIPAARDINLDLLVNNNFYFQGWMLGGPFHMDQSGKLPEFLYSEREGYNKPPSPGDFTHYQGVTYRWQKYASPNGGIVDLDELYNYKSAAFAYAYCSINSANAANVPAFLSDAKGIEIYCNGKKLDGESRTMNSNQPEKQVTLALKAGTNHILIKYPRTKDHWSFTFRLDSKIKVTGRKHKYTLNPKTEVHEAE